MRASVLAAATLVVLLVGVASIALRRATEQRRALTAGLNEVRGDVKRQVQAIEERLTGLETAVDKLSEGPAPPPQVDPADLRAEIVELGKRMRVVEDTVNEAARAARDPRPGTIELLEVITDPEVSREQRNKAIWELVNTSDVEQHLDEVLDFYRRSGDELLRNSLENVLRMLAEKLQSERIIDVVLEDVRERGGAGASSSVLARFYGEERLEELEQYVADSNENVQGVATVAIGHLEKSERTVSALRNAQQHTNPVVRGLASFSLAGHGETFFYEGVIEDWHQMLFSERYELVFSLPRFDPARVIEGLPQAELQKAVDLFEEVRTRHEDPRVRQAALEAVQAKTRRVNEPRVTGEQNLEPTE